MDSEPQIVQIVSSTGEIVEFESKIADLSDLISSMPDKHSPLQTEISTEILQFMKRFAEKHTYDRKSINFTWPTKGPNAKQNICEKSYDLLKDYIVENNISETSKRLAPLINAADLLRFGKLYTTLNIALISPLHIDESEKAVHEFMENFCLKEDEDFSADKINELIKNNNPLFELVVSRFIQNIAELDKIQGISV